MHVKMIQLNLHTDKKEKKRKIMAYAGLNFIELQRGMQVPVNFMRRRHLNSDIKKVQVELILEYFLH